MSANQPVVPATSETLAKRVSGAALDVFEQARARLSMREENFFLLLAVVIGLFSGLAVVCFRIAIDYTRLWLLGSAIAPSPLRVLLVPTLAGLALAFLVIRVFPRVRGSGVSHTKAAVYIYDGYIPFDTVIGKFPDRVRFGNRQRPIPRPGRSLAPDGRRNGLGIGQTSASLARKNPSDCAGRCGGRFGRGIQRANFSGAFCN